MYQNFFVCLFGICTVFLGLICLIVLTILMSKAVQAMGRHASISMSIPEPMQSAGRAAEVSPEIVAAISCALAEDMELREHGLRIVSIKKL